MARQRKQKQEDVNDIKLVQPDRSGPDPTQQTLLDLADQRGLFDEHTGQEEPLVGRLGDSILWTLSLTMLHTTLDVLVQHQYAVDISWAAIVSRSLQAFPSKKTNVDS
ncbi:hypothetical protein PVAG01_04979 [Phlyctema vagabunda]|uniref:Uncharacterized protein n=1 Tax=Phlyctema vagabunda TaxID=108571 RepID=A0ABR4PJH5_9HELO